MLRPVRVIAFLYLNLLWLGSANPRPQSLAKPSVTADAFLEASTPVHLRLAEQITSKKAKAGQRVAFQVSDDVMVGRFVAIPRGTMAWGQISHAQPSKMLGKGGKLAIELDSVPALTGEQIPLRGATDREGQFQMGGLGLLTIFVLPLLPLQRGDQAEIPKGTILTAFVKSRVALDTERLAGENRALDERLKSPTPRVPGKAVVSIYGLYSYEVQRWHIGYLVRLDGTSLVHLLNHYYLTIQLESGEHTLSSDNAELKLRVEKNMEYYVKVTDVVRGQKKLDKITVVEPVLEVVSPENGEPEMYPFAMCSRHDIKNRAIVVTGSQEQFLPPPPGKTAQPPVGEIESKGLATAEAKDVVDIAKVDTTHGSFLETEIRKIEIGSGAQGIAFTQGTIWVACENGVARIDDDTYKVEARIATGRSAAGVAASAGGVWIANRVDNTVTRVDPDSNRVVATIHVGKSPLGVDAGAGSIWVANTGDGTVSRIDPRTNMVVATIHVGRRLGGVSANDQAVWVTNSGSQSAEKATLNRIDPATNAVTQSIKGPWLNVVLAQGDDVWVSGLDATVSRINAKSGDLMARIVVVPHSWKGLSGLAVSKGILWAADLEGSGLWKIDLKSNAVVGKFAVGNGPIIFGRGVDADGAIWVSNLRGGTVTRVQP